MNFKKLLMVMTILFVAVILNASQLDVVKKRFDVVPGKQVSVEFSGKDGDVIVETHEKNEILFKFTKEMKGGDSEKNKEYFQEIQPKIEFADNELEIKIKYPQRSFNIFDSLSGMRLKVVSRLVVPANTELEVKVSDGNVEVSGIRLEVEAKSTDGDINVEDCKGELELRSTDGNITVKNCRGNLDVSTTDGDVEASGVFTGLKFKGTDGNGHFTLEEGSKLTKDCQLRSTDGDIKLQFHDGMAFRVKAKCSDGDIRFKKELFETIDEQKSNRLKAQRGDALHTIEIKTSDGDISLKKL